MSEANKAARIEYLQELVVTLRNGLTNLRDECLHEATKTDCYTCYTDQAAHIAHKLSAILEKAK